MEFIVPSMQVDESDVGTRSVQQLSLAGIGIVGTFKKGPVNTPTTIGDDIQYTKIFGIDKPGLTGPKSVKGCFDNGANDLRIVRIVGEGAKAASVTLKDDQATPADSIVITAISVGVWGDDLKATVVANGTKVDIIVTDGENTDTFKSVSLDRLPLSKNVVTLTKATGATKLPKVIADVPLTGGNDGAAVTDEDYIGTITESGKRTGLKALEPVQCGLALCAQQYSSSIHQALIAWAENCDIEEGLRIPILNSPPGFGVDAVCVQTQTLDTADGRGIFTYPWVTPADETDDDIFVAPDGYYAGRLAALNPCKSPSNKQILGIRKLENDFKYAEVKVLTLARISPITLVPNRGFRVRNGVTLSSDTAWNQTNIRRQQDKMEMELYNSMQWAISEDHDTPLWDAIATQADAYLRTQQKLGFIKGYLPTLCNSQTNPDENIIARILTFIVRWKPLYAADFIIMKIKRELPSATA
ncbi:phage tail sheath subtilisin-like domain-containing protein [Sporomusa sp. KB1]|jgi:phage tail sheath protein FI|uniref:phage tail sheath subtilisin-like domain-containing protein n=1 Tax=Sporomusa sp. KB1 TaxID=943346 RepID=UPI0021065F4A|nr:phage tail sheath subtilisin-like domain-containing protein [Sporomusa sp. KB1]